MSSTGAIAAYKGYRNQALYALHRVLKSQQQGTYFQPEKYEDLTVYKDSGEILEAIQVKDLSGNLSLSDFAPEKTDSFFRRALKLIKKNPSVSVNIISFGPIGPEMRNAWAGDQSFRTTISKKLSNHGFSSDDVETLFSNIKILTADESILKDDIFSFLKSSLVGGDPENAFDLLHYWLYKASEKRELITYGTLIAKINSVGRYLSERALHYQEWFTSIVPLEDSTIGEDERERLSNEFYQGVSTQYKHILANFDIVRDDKLQLLENSLQKKRIVILHGASGQGKSTLAYRYLKEFIPEKWRYEIRLIEDRQHALRIARALSGHANAVNAPMVIYVDVSPRDKGWPDLLKELSSHNNFYILVTVREEDFTREYISKSDFDFESIELTFDEKEAARIYEKLISIKQPGQFLSFKEAWSRFGAGGPLMEFVYLITQSESLRERLRSQIEKLRDMVREGMISKNELGLVRMVSVASAYDARLDTRLLCEMLSLEEPTRTLDLLEKEYLLRQSAEGKYVEGLHHIRSSIVADLLTDTVLSPWLNVATDCLSLIVEDDLEIFLLYSFSRHTKDAESMFETLQSLQPKTWTGLAGVFRALLWLGLSQYVDKHRDLIHELFERFGAGWQLFLDFDIANVSGGFAAEWFKNLDFIPAENKKIIETIQKKQLPKENVFAFASQWISKVTGSTIPPAKLSDWSGLAELCFWLGHLNIESPISLSVDDQLVDSAMETLPLHHLADLHFALSFLWKDRFDLWIEKKKDRTLDRFREDTNTVFIEDDGETIRSHFIIELEINEEPPDDQKGIPQSDNKLHDEALKRVELLRKLFPVRKKYGCQGYGHRFEILKLPHDDTVKTGIAASQFPPLWGVKLNSRFINLSIYAYRPETWRDYIDLIYQARARILDTLKDLQNGMIAHYREHKVVDIFKHYIDSINWEACRSIVFNPPALPKSVVDEWGFVDESKIKHSSISTMSSPTDFDGGAKQPAGWTEISLTLWQYRKYLSSLRNFTVALSHFYQQARDVLVFNAFVGKAKSVTEIEQIHRTASDSGIKTDLAGLATYNFAEAVKGLLPFQKEFKKLFSFFYERDALSVLEKQELDVIIKSWSLWFQFAMHPRRHFQDFEGESIQKLKKTLKQMQKDIQKCFKKLNSSIMNVSLHSENTLWDDCPGLWIIFDVANPINLYEYFESVINSIKSAIGIVEHNRLKHYALDFWWPTIVIVPLIRGKSLNKMAWKLNTLVLCNSDFSEDNWWNYMPHPIPADSWNALGLSLWEHPRLDLVNKFHTATASFSLFVAHLNDFNKLPELDEKGINLLRNYIISFSGKVSEMLQLFFDSITEMLTYYNSLGQEQKDRRPYLLEAVKILVKIHSQITAGRKFQGKVEIGLSETQGWIRELKEAMGQAEVFQMLWITDILETAHS